MLVSSDDIVPFLCQSTGKCCIHNIVILSSFDIFRISKFMKVSAKELFQKKILTYRINPSTYWMEPIINSKSNATCPFLFRDIGSEKYLCEIYDSRPLVCRIYPLKYDKEENIFMRFFPAEHRCYECITSTQTKKMNEYLIESDIPELLKEFNVYLSLIDQIIESGFNLNKIKGNKPAQKKFFEMQAILYESYPKKDEIFNSLPFDEIKSKVVQILNSQN